MFQKCIFINLIFVFTYCPLQNNINPKLARLHIILSGLETSPKLFCETALSPSDVFSRMTSVDGKGVLLGTVFNVGKGKVVQSKIG